MVQLFIMSNLYKINLIHLNSMFNFILMLLLTFLNVKTELNPNIMGWLQYEFTM